MTCAIKCSEFKVTAKGGEKREARVVQSDKTNQQPRAAYYSLSSSPWLSSGEQEQ